jgi:divalent metal cation (Fe/Co/Zn/Cd) transporter
VSLRRSERPADHAHPFGYGEERFFYALIAAMGIFLSGAAFSAYQGVSALLSSGTAAVLLGYVAVILGRDTKELLIGESADPVVRATAFATITSHPEITGVKEILTMQLGPASVLVAARVQFEDDLNAKRVQLVCTDIEAEMRERMPELTQVFLDPSEVSTDDLHRRRQRERQILDDVDQLNGPSGVAELRSPRSRSARRITSSGP